MQCTDRTRLINNSAFEYESNHEIRRLSKMNFLKLNSNIIIHIALIVSQAMADLVSLLNFVFVITSVFKIVQ